MSSWNEKAVPCKHLMHTQPMWNFSLTERSGKKCFLVWSNENWWIFLKKRKYPVSEQLWGQNTLSMSLVRGEWTDWLKMIERQVKSLLVTTKYAEYHLWTLKQMGYNSRRPHGGLFCQLRTLNWGYDSHRLTRIGQQKIGKMLPGLMTLDFSNNIQMIRIWHKQHKSMDLSWLVSMVQAAACGIMVWRIFSWHALSPWVFLQFNLRT